VSASASVTVFPSRPRSGAAVLAQSQLEAGPDPKSARRNSNEGQPLVLGQTAPTRAEQGEISFGPFRLVARQFLLLEGDEPVPVGSRALEILTALVERPGDLVTKEELMARVWPDVFVEPSNLSVHISTLRRVLRDGRDGNRFIINIPGRGYSFVAPVVVPNGIKPNKEVAQAATGDTVQHRPLSLGRMALKLS
jgi:DNA-binding winged helix-turn-helix (wHTH) protein